MPNIVILDGYTLNPGDLSWDVLRELGEVSEFPRTPEELIFDRSREADILIVNKTELDEALLSRLTRLRCICVSATGYNNVDVKAVARNGITVCNVVGYSTPSVAQHVFALLLQLANKTSLHTQDVRAGGWSASPDWCYWKQPLIELSGRVMGIYGLGKIGGEVARIALAFGMRVIATRRHPQRPGPPGVVVVELDRLFADSDVLSLHAPLTVENRGVVNTRRLSTMKTGAFLINTSRGGLINETDLRKALLDGPLAGAGLDVLCEEPPPVDHPLAGLPNCIITPHQAWATQASRQRLLDQVVENVRAFIKGKPKNVVVQPIISC